MHTSDDMPSFGPTQLLAGLAGIPCILLGTAPAHLAAKNSPADEDGGRPVALIAEELGVTAEQFREAFKKVRLAQSGQQLTTELRRANRRLLAETLGVSLERLDVVMDKYRPGVRVDLPPPRPAVEIPPPKGAPSIPPPASREGGRSVEQIARELSVTPEQFREAFKQVRPAMPGERPTEEQRHANRKILSDSLGVSLERLNEVMDRYRPGLRVDNAQSLRPKLPNADYSSQT